MSGASGTSAGRRKNKAGTGAVTYAPKRRCRSLMATAVLCFAVALFGCAADTLPAASAASGGEEPLTQSAGPESGREAELSVPAAMSADPADHEETEETPVETELKLLINNREMPVIWEENASVAALKELSKNGLTVQMSMYGGFEQVGSLGESLPRNDKQTVTDYGDIVLYSGDQIVVFYGSNSWSYTRLGHIELTKAEMTDLLSNGNVTLTLTTGQK